MKRKKLLKKILSLGMALTLVVSFCACGSGSSDISGHSDETIKIGSTAWPTTMFMYLAKDKGYFKKNGVNVEIEMFQSDSDSHQAFTAGELDMATYPTSDVVTPYSKGVELKVVMNNDLSAGADGLVATKNIKSIKDLKGKKIATEFYTIDHYFILLLLEQNGLTTDDVELVNMTIQNSGSAFIAGKVDAACIWEPTLTKALNEGKGHLLASSGDKDLNYLTDSLVASQTMCDERGEDVYAVIKSIYQAEDYYKAHKKEAMKIMSKYLGADFKSSAAGLHFTTLDECVDQFTNSDKAAYVPSISEKIGNFLKDYGQIDSVPSDFDSMIDSRFVEKLKSEESSK